MKLTLALVLALGAGWGWGQESHKLPACQKSPIETSEGCENNGICGDGEDSIHFHCYEKPKPSPQITVPEAHYDNAPLKVPMAPQITVERAVASGSSRCKPCPEGQNCLTRCDAEPIYSCPSDSALGPFENRKGEHWCLKIEEPAK